METENDLLYRGYNVTDLSQNCVFEEVCFLLLNGKLPNSLELKDFTKKIFSKRYIPKSLISVLEKIPKETNPMDVFFPPSFPYILKLNDLENISIA